MSTTSPDELVTLVDGTSKRRGDVTADEARELEHWRAVKEERTREAAERRRAGRPRLCAYYDRARGRFCAEESTTIHTMGESGMASVPFCDRHLKIWHT